MAGSTRSAAAAAAAAAKKAEEERTARRSAREAALARAAKAEEETTAACWERDAATALATPRVAPPLPRPHPSTPLASLPRPSASRTASDVRDWAADEPTIESTWTRKRRAASASSSDSNPDALGIDESEKGIFGSLKSIVQLPPSPSKDGDWLGDTATGTAESPAAEEAGKKFPVAGIEKQTGDQPKSPAAAANVDLILLETPRQEVEKPDKESTANLAKQVTEQAKFLRRTGEGLQLTANQTQQLEKMAALEKSSREQSEKVRLLEAWVEALEQDNSVMKDKASKLQEKAKTAAKEKKELKSLLLQRDELVTDLKNIMYHHEYAMEKLTKIKANADKEMVSDMRQIKELSQQLADLEVAAKVVVDMVEDEGAGEKSLLERLREAP
ncbi:uncharacterized protein LOC120695212 [Panicum virgatum]|uniref:uncharacterized protein LOC120695212 n=1 Tax=Panicum virgatum TaxID=38727 RepID=UPI0019D60F7A|nr:uncharacterized protein LOC120695212 [Panicum virgatum]